MIKTDKRQFPKKHARRLLDSDVRSIQNYLLRSIENDAEIYVGLSEPNARGCPESSNTDFPGRDESTITTQHP